MSERAEMECKRCGDNEDRIDGFCSNECKDKYSLEEALSKMSIRIAELERMKKTADENLLEAGMSVDLCFGSDTPGVMADTIMSLRKRIAELEGKIDQLTAHSDIERQDDKSSPEVQE